MKISAAQAYCILDTVFLENFFCGVFALYIPDTLL